MPPIQYDGRSLVPDINQALGIALGMAEKKAAERKDEQRKAEVAGLEDQLDLTVADPMTNPANLRTIQRMARVDPQAAQFGLGILRLKSEDELQDVARESAEASNFYQAFLDTDDPTERNRVLASAIREREEAGKDTGKLRELIGLDANKQKLFARRQIILAGDAQLLANDGLDALIKQTDLQNKLLERDQKLRDLAHGKYGDVSAMRDDFTKQSQPYIVVRDAYQRVQASRGDKTAAGDMALLYSYMKLLDPTSAVRETEYANAENAAGVPERIRNLFNKAKDGQFLDDKQRDQFRSTADGLFAKQQASHDKLRGEFSRLAGLRNFNPAEVVVDYSAPAAQQPQVAPPPVPATSFQEGAVLKDKTTGKRWMVKGGKWLPAE